MTNRKSYQTIITAVMIIISLICIIPFVLLISSSITSEEMLVKNGYSFWPKRIDLSAYRYLLFGSRAVARGYLISILVTAFGTSLSLVLTILFAYPLSRKDLPGRNIFSFFIFFTMLFNGGLVPTYIMWTQIFHIKNTLWALIFPNLLMNAFNVIMMRTYFMTSVPEEVIEAARIDGSGEFRILFGIVVPMALPIIVTVMLLVGLGYWNDWLNGLYYINNDKYYSIQVLLTKMLENVEMVKKASSAGASAMKMPSTSIRMAVAVIGALPVLVVYPFFQKYFVKGIVIGAVKG
ncbi:MAG TPA: sugar ABC transporter permease [Treponema sp.]|nr:sugar ABC transporter permease [Treponema sp.]